MIFPKPKTAQYGPCCYRLKEDYSGCDLLTFYRRIREGNRDVEIKTDSLLEGEAYCLLIGDQGIQIAISTQEGLFRGAASLWQLVRKGKGELPRARVQDAPELKRRGYMLDISRGRMPTMETLKTLVDYLAALKYNEFQLYFEGMCFDYSAYPEYTRDFACLTPRDIRELDEYCAQRFIDLVPNQNSFGHMACWLEQEQFRHLGLTDGVEAANTLNPMLKESYEFVQGLYESVLPHFRSAYVNIGLDEAYGLGRFQTEEYCKTYGKDRVFMQWLNQLSTLAREKYGKKVMFWADMIYHYQSLYHQIPKDAIALEWGYELIQSQMMTEHCMSFRDAGIKYYVCPSCNTHMAFTGRFDVTSFNIRTCAELAVQFGAEGILLTDWGNCGHPQFGVWSLLPIALCGQYGWNTGAKQDGETFKADFIHAAQRYVDETVFGCSGVSVLLYRLANYYLLEPERVHVGTMCGEMFTRPFTETNYAYFYDLKDCGDAFYFDNVTAYVRKVMADVEKLDFDSLWKREILLNSQMVILASECCKLRLELPLRTEEKENLLALADEIEAGYRDLWNRRNFEKGMEIFLDQLKEHREALTAYPVEP